MELAGWTEAPSDDPHRGSVPEAEVVGRIFDGLSPHYDRVVQLYTFGQDFRWKSVLVRKLNLHRGETALDLACGTGLIARRLADRLGERSVVGADINRAMLQAAVDGRRSGALVQADAQRLPFRAGSFDVVTAGYLLKYVNLRVLLAEVARVLRPGGRFGGYDFSRPIRETQAGRLAALYLDRILPIAGRRRNREVAGWREVFSFLRRTIEESGWEARLRSELSLAGFREIELSPSLGGAITWAWAHRL